MPKRNTNALKHGAFSGQIILPGETIEDLDELHESNMKEWKPVGPVELDCVSTLTNCLWRKRRISRYQELKLKRLQSIMSLKEARGLSESHLMLLEGFSESLSDSEMLTDLCEHNLDDYLPPNSAKYIRDAVPRKNYPDDAAWIAAITDEIKNITLRAKEFMPPHRGVSEVRLMQIEEVFNEDQMAKELELEERIDALIDKSVKRLIQAKTLKEIINTKPITAEIHHEEAQQIAPVNGNRSTSTGTPI